jgi:hypothetical protein
MLTDLELENPKGMLMLDEAIAVQTEIKVIKHDG